jgi:hypothetical protein
LAFETPGGLSYLLPSTHFRPPFVPHCQALGDLASLNQRRRPSPRSKRRLRGRERERLPLRDLTGIAEGDAVLLVGSGIVANLPALLQGSRPAGFARQPSVEVRGAGQIGVGDAVAIVSTLTKPVGTGVATLARHG